MEKMWGIKNVKNAIIQHKMVVETTDEQSWEKL